METELRGTMACPICGQDTPHHHPTMDAYQTHEAAKTMLEQQERIELYGRAMTLVEYLITNGQIARAIWVARGALKGEYDRKTVLGIENPTMGQLESMKAASDMSFALDKMRRALEDIEYGPQNPWFHVAYSKKSFGDACQAHAKQTLDHISTCIGLQRSGKEE
jgi:hypothetical protein